LIDSRRARALVTVALYVVAVAFSICKLFSLVTFSTFVEPVLLVALGAVLYAMAKRAWDVAPATRRSYVLALGFLNGLGLLVIIKLGFVVVVIAYLTFNQLTGRPTHGIFD